MDDRPLRILMIANGGRSFGGVENFFYQYYKHIDKSAVHWDFGFCRGNSFEYRINDPVFAESKIVVLSTFRFKYAIVNYYYLFKDLIRFLRGNEYDVIHINTGIIYAQISCLAAAKYMRVPVRIAHSHSAIKSIPSGNFISRTLKKIYRDKMRFWVAKWSTKCLACGKDAGVQLFGNHDFSIIKNAIDVEKYKYNMGTRIRLREELGIKEDSLVIGTVGRLSSVKNPLFSLRVFQEVSSLIHNVSFLMIGSGDLMPDLMLEAQKLGIFNQVKFLGARKDVPDLLQVLDGYIMPSLYEGLSIAAIEAQAAGLSCLLSDTIPRETNVTGKCKFMSLYDSPNHWATTIVDMIRSNSREDEIGEVLRNAGYDIQSEANKLKYMYIQEYERTRG